MADASKELMSPLTSSLIMRVIDSFKRDEILKRDCEHHLRNLEHNIVVVEKYRDAIVLEDKSSYDWYTELKDVMYVIVDALEIYLVVIEAKAKSDRIKNILYTIGIRSIKAEGATLSLGHIIELINMKIDGLLAKAGNEDHVKLIESQLKEAPKEMPTLTSLPIDNNEMLGRDDIKSDMIWKLRADFNEELGAYLRILPIVGTSGIGKTMLAQSVYASEKHHFDLCAWVHCASGNIETEALLKIILAKLGENVLDKNFDLDHLVAALEAEVKNKRFLLVMDNVLCKQKTLWIQLLNPLTRGKRGSRLIITTTDMEVINMIRICHQDEVEPEMKLDSLEGDYLWKIVRTHAFGVCTPIVPTNIEQIGRDIVKKLKGLPLAAKAIGGVLGADYSESHWKKILCSDIWISFKSKSGITLVPTLMLSFLHLQHHTKPCFTYCSLFPMGEAINERELVQQWHAHGYLQTKDAESVEDSGATVLNDLQRLHLITRISHTFGSFIEMHDLIHETSHAMGRDDHLQVLEGGKLDNLPWERLRHLFISSAKKFSTESLIQLGNCKKLRTLIFIRPHPLKLEISVLGTWFRQLPCLRVLTLRHLGIEELPDEIGELIHLRYLDLSGNPIRKLPRPLDQLHNLQVIILTKCKSLLVLSSEEMEFLGQLSRLQYLDLSWNYKMETLPAPLTLLSDLRVLRLSYCHRLKEFPDAFDNLKRLEYLDLQDCFSIEELPEGLGSLFHLRELNIDGCKRLSSLGNQLANLKDLRRLHVESGLLSTICEIGKLTLLDTVGRSFQWYANKIGELANLNMLHGKLEIRNIDALHFVADAEQGKLEQKVHLAELSLEWNPVDHSIQDVKIAEGILVHLKPNKHLRELTIHNYIGGKLPSWLTSEHLQYLKRLSLFSSHIMVIRGILMYRDNSEIFPFLEELKFVKLPKLLQWIEADTSNRWSFLGGLSQWIGADKSDGWFFLRRMSQGIRRNNSCQQASPGLRRITLSECPQLKVMPHLPLSLESMKLVSVGLEKLPFLQCQSQEEALSPRDGNASSSVSQSLVTSFLPPSSLVRITISSCPVSSLVVGILASQLPYLRRLTIKGCLSLELPPPNGFQDFKSLEKLKIVDCPKLSRLSTEMDAGLPPHVHAVQIVNCRGLITESLQMSLLALSSLQHLDLRNYCRDMSNSFVKAVVGPLLEMTKVCKINIQDDQRYYIHIKKATEVSFHWKCHENNINVSFPSSSTELLMDILKYLQTGSSPLTELFIPEVDALILVNGNSSKFFHELIHSSKHLKFIQGKESLYEPHAICIKGCDTIQSLHEGVLNHSWPHVRHLTISNCINLETLPRSGFTTLAMLEWLTLEGCPKLTKLSVEDDSALPSSLHQLIIRDCGSFEVDSILRKSFTSLRKLVIENNSHHGHHSFVKGVLANFYENLVECIVCSKDKSFQFHWRNNARIAASISWNCINKRQETTGQFGIDDEGTSYGCTRLEVLNEMLRSKPPSPVKELYVAGMHEITVIPGNWEKLIRNLTSLEKLTIAHWDNLCSLPANMSGLSSLTKLEILSCGNFSPPEEIWKIVEAGKTVSVETSDKIGTAWNRVTHKTRMLRQKLVRPLRKSGKKWAFFGLNFVKHLKLWNCDKLCSLPYSSFLKTLEIRGCNGIRDLSSLNSPLPCLHKLLISNCHNLEDPPKRGFMSLVSLRSLILINCHKLSRLSLEDNCFFPQHLYELEIIHCRGIRMESLQMSLGQQGGVSIRKFKLENSCHHISYPFVKNVVTPLSETTERWEIKFVDFNLHMLIEKGTTGERVVWCSPASRSLATEKEEQRFHTELLVQVLNSLGLSLIKQLFISEFRYLILVNIELLQCLCRLVKPTTRFVLQGGPSIKRSEWFFIEGCEIVKRLDDGILNQNQLRCLCYLLVQNRVHLEVPQITADWKSLTAVSCPNLTQLSLKDGKPLPSTLQEMVIRDCDSLQIDSLLKSLRDGPFSSLRKLVLENSPSRIVNSFVKELLALPNLSHCNVCSHDPIFKILWQPDQSDYEGIDYEQMVDNEASKQEVTKEYIARIEWDCIIMEINGKETVIHKVWEEDIDRSCTRKELLTVMLRRILSFRVTKLCIGGVHGLVCINEEMDQLFHNLVDLRELTFAHCMHLRYEGIQGHTAEKKPRVLDCSDKFSLDSISQTNTVDTRKASLQTIK